MTRHGAAAEAPRRSDLRPFIRLKEHSNALEARFRTDACRRPRHCGRHDARPAARRSPSTVAAQAADQTYGMAIMSAWVHTDGTIVRGAGVVDAVLNDGEFSKSYNVKFNRPLNGCVSTVSPLSASSPVFATSWVIPDNDYVQVVLWLSGGGTVKHPFQLILFCSQ
jgi:hypothetical protein